MVERRRSSSGPTPEEVRSRSLATRRAAEDSLPALLEDLGGSSLREEILEELAVARELLPYRESGKHYLMMGYELIRLAIQELGRRWDLGGDIYFLRRAELEEFPGDRSRLREEIAARRLRWQAAQRLEMAPVLDSERLPELGRPQPLEALAGLTATPVASGVATGVARVVFEARQAADLESGYILVCPSTDPGWTPLFLDARGLVVERGGVLSHGAIVARDFGIPAVVCPDATRRLRSGDRVRLDGNAGRIEVLGPGREAADA
jgi:pyruvate,water dikinase